jgi:hypothetical protein
MMHQIFRKGIYLRISVMSIALIVLLVCFIFYLFFLWPINRQKKISVAYVLSILPEEEGLYRLCFPHEAKSGFSGLNCDSIVIEGFEGANMRKYVINGQAIKLAETDENDLCFFIHSKNEIANPTYFSKVSCITYMSTTLYRSMYNGEGH